MKIGICMMTRNEEYLDPWIEYHLNQLKFDYLLLRIENTILKDKKDCRIIYVQHEMDASSTKKNSIVLQQYRQKKFVDYCIQSICCLYGITFLLHIDDDELFWLNPEMKSVHDFVQLWNKKDLDYLRFQNFEAVLNRTSVSNTNIFQTTNLFIDCSKEKCRSYSNGKSMVILKDIYQYSTGCHTFSGKSTLVPIDDAKILHFDSVDFSMWRKKFSHLSQISPEIFASIPFPFYKQSIMIQNSPLEIQKRFWLEHVIYKDQQHVFYR